MADKLSRLIKNQKVFIDAHDHENNVVEREVMYDDKGYDLHLHKKTNPVSINGKKECTVDIRIPINNPDREIKVEVNAREIGEIPCVIKREVEKELNKDKTQERIAKELAEILATYPSSVKGNKEKTEETLRRLASAFGATAIPVKDEWFTHVIEEPKGVSMLSMKVDDEKRYNFLACDKFMHAEEAEPTTKSIIRLYGGEKRGKTASITMAFKMLMERFFENAIIIDDGEKSGDIKALLFVKGAKVGIESRGDPNSRQMRSVDEFVSMGCDVILIASRTWGMTKNSIEKYRGEYRIFKFRKNKDTDESMRYKLNQEVARTLAVFVEGCATEAFAEL